MRRTAMPLAGILVSAIFTVGAATMLTLNWPGQMSYDSIMQLSEGRSGLYLSWHPPIMAALLGMFDRVLPGSGLFVLLLGALALFSFLALARPRRATGWSVALALLAVASPQWLLYQGLVWKDVLFADAALAGFAALALGARPGAGAGWLWLAGALFILAVMSRQNGLVILPFAALAEGWIVTRGLSRRRALWHAALFLALTFSAAAAGELALAARGDHGAGAAGEMRFAQSYDLAGMLVRDPALRLARLEHDRPALALLLRTRGTKLYATERIDPFQDDPILDSALEKTPAPLVFAQWRASILRHPLVYLRTRAAVFWQVVATPDRIACRPLFVGVDGDPATMAALGLARRWRPQDRLLNRYGLALVKTPFFSHLAFAGLAGGLLLWLALYGRGGPDQAVAALLAAALAFAASFFIVSVACDYRYLYFLDLAALAGALHVCARKN